MSDLNAGYGIAVPVANVPVTAATPAEAPAPVSAEQAPLAPGTVVRHDGRYGIVLAHVAGELGDAYDVALFSDVRVALRLEALEVA